MSRQSPDGLLRSLAPPPPPQQQQQQHGADGDGSVSSLPSLQTHASRRTIQSIESIVSRLGEREGGYASKISPIRSPTNAKISKIFSYTTPLHDYCLSGPRIIDESLHGDGAVALDSARGSALDDESVSTLRSSASIRRLLRTPPDVRRLQGERILFQEQLEQQRKEAAELMVQKIRAQETNIKHVSNFIRHYSKIKMEYASRDRIAREKEEELHLKQHQALAAQRAAAARALSQKASRLTIGLSTKTVRGKGGGSKNKADYASTVSGADMHGESEVEIDGIKDAVDEAEGEHVVYADEEDDETVGSIGDFSVATSATADSSLSHGALSLASAPPGAAQPISEAQLREAYQKYFRGAGASATFYSLFKKASRDFSVFTADDSLVPAAHRSPPEAFLREQTRAGLLPLSLLLRSGKDIKGVVLAHRGLGDLRALPLVGVIDTLPAVEVINLSDNRLTDASLMPLALKLERLTSLTSLDLSHNKIDDSSRVIQAYICSERCTLRSLALEGADIDDAECCSLVDALIANRSIETLSLAKNKIGSNELLNVVMPDVETGGEALARLLLKNSTITSLDLSWNAIRLASAEQFGAALEFNRGLRRLSVAYNAFGSRGTQMLGRSVKFNRHRLEHLDVSYNSLDQRACQVLANGAATNRHLRHINVDGNALGGKGNMALIGAIQRSTHKGKHLVVSFKRCDLEPKDDSTIFDPEAPGGCYDLDLSKPYDYMVADELFFLANAKAGVEIHSLEYDKKAVPLARLAVSSSGSGSGKFNIKMYYGFCRSLARELLGGSVSTASKHLDSIFLMFGLVMDEHKRLDTLLAVKEQWRLKNGRKSDLKNVILFEVFVALFALNDSDKSGTIELDEFLRVLASLGKRDFDPRRLRLLMMEYDNDDSGSVDEQEFALIMVNQFCGTALPRGAMVEKASGKPFRLQRSGMCKIVVRYECSLPSKFDLGDDTGFLSIIHSIEVAETEHEKLGIFRQAITSPYFYFDARQAQLLLEHTKAFALKREEVVAAILPQIVSAEQCLLFINGNLDDGEKLVLRLFMGPSLNIYLGCTTGHYLFDLSARADTVAGKKLAAVSASESAVCRAAGLDTSQKGNGQNFRNEQLFRVAASGFPAVSGEWFARPPANGMLRADYVSTTRPLQGTAAMSSKRFEAFLARMELGVIKARTGQLRDVAAAAQAVREAVVPPPLTIVAVKEHLFEYMDSCHHFHDVFPVERELFVSGSRTPPALRNEQKPDPQYMHPLFPLLYSKLLLFQLMVPSTYFSVQQVLLLLRQLPAFAGCAYIRMLQSCLGAIVDLENIHLVVDGLFTADERNEAVHRMGLLNLYDPLRAERRYRLDLRKHDDREMAKLLIQLSLREPGDNFKDAEFRWTRYDESIPGWSVPAPWATRDESSGGEGGPRRHGWFSFEYETVGEGGSKHVDMGARKELRKLTLAGLKRTL